MRFTELSDYPLPAGRLTAWVPSTRCDGATWSADARPLAYTHEDHCARGSGDRAASTSWLGGVFEIHHRYDADKVASALRAWMLRHETFRTTVVENLDGQGTDRFSRRTTSGELLGVDAVAHQTLTSEHMHAKVIDFFDNHISPFAWPHCVAATIETPESFLLIFGADHSVMDAYSMLLAISEIHRLYEYELFGTDPGLPDVGSHLDFSVHDRELGNSVVAEHHAVKAWSRFLRQSGGKFPAFPLPVDTSVGSEDAAAQQGSSSSWLLNAEQAEAVNAYSRQAGHGMQSAILASVALANRELTGDPTLRFTMPMHTRHELAYRFSVGWYVGIVPVEVNLRGATTFEDCLVAATTAVASAKELARFPYPRIAELLDNSAIPRFALSYLDVRYVPDAEQWPQWRARTLRGRSESNDEVYFWISRAPAGLTISTRFPGNTTATGNVERLISTFGSMLTSVADGGNFAHAADATQRAS
ncbi:Aureobasidin A1 biosynthesis complex [Antrihabitans sp. YC3-6]|uniref:Aureobasidin A1 biosynthesis complex n=1 Tax=Antrihabitans stalagmiti TaxID=2799499 RepID=A0A934NMG1_9NOCA|nr:condensation domain-containing protein [Antrihabitans stalagmiti]MBJ8337822.1 Aureobasidin A1 biosynthesis complex [Antrihabitans stalagmiti]